VPGASSIARSSVSDQRDSWPREIEHQVERHAFEAVRAPLEGDRRPARVVQPAEPEELVVVALTPKEAG
jgi:hypothetical protein